MQVQHKNNLYHQINEIKHITTYLASEPPLTSCNRIPVTAPRTGNESTVSKPVT